MAADDVNRRATEAAFDQLRTLWRRKQNTFGALLDFPAEFQGARDDIDGRVRHMIQRETLREADNAAWRAFDTACREHFTKD